MLVVQPLALGASDEELAAVRVRAAVRHREEARAGVRPDEGLVLELGALARRDGAREKRRNENADRIGEVRPRRECWRGGIATAEEEGGVAGSP